MQVATLQSKGSAVNLANDNPSALMLRSARRAGFSFVEVLFAVMILGIGFIMIAGVFPVAISQTASTQEDTVGSALIRDGVATVANVPGLAKRISDLSTTTPGAVLRLEGDDWRKIQGNQIYRDDPRYAWIPLLRQNPPDANGRPSTIAQLIVVPIQVRGRSNFDATTDFKVNGSAAAAAATLLPLYASVTLFEGTNNPDTVTLAGGPGAQAAAPGAVLVIASNQPDKGDRPMAGRVYRLGSQISTSPVQFELLPGNDMQIINGQSQEPKNPGSAVDAYVIGRYVDPTTGVGEGVSMAFGSYVTYITLKQ